MSKLYIREMFESIQGEGIRVGEYTLFIRTNGCNFSCVWCDTAYAIKKDEKYKMSLKKIEERIRRTKSNSVCITGGEPMIQDIEPIIDIAKKYKKFITIETNGSIFKKELMEKVDLWSISPKLSSAKTVHWTEKDTVMVKFLENWTGYNIQIKLVVGSEKDLEEVRYFYKEFYLETIDLPFFIMPVHKKWLAKKIFEDWDFEELPMVRLSIQQHKYMRLK